MKFQKFVAGFMFSEDLANVALVEKNRPAFQAGKYNAIGGKIEEGEDTLSAMIREFKEETGVLHTGWNLFCDLKGDWGEVYFFKTTGDLSKLKTMEDEKIVIVSVGGVDKLPTLSKISWLLPMALNSTVKVSVTEAHEEG
jgi:8-oxo-dGTP diphosphatase